MAEEVTRAQLEELRRDVEETKWLVYAVMGALVGKEKSDQALGEVRRWLDADARRFERGTPVFDVTPGHTTAYGRLIDADLYTLEEVAAKQRKEVAAIEGVGRVTMRWLEGAMDERGLTWAEAV